MLSESTPQKTCTVKFNAYAFTTMSSTLFGAVRNAWEWFQDPYWQGPRPGRDAVFEVFVTGTGERFRVRVADALR
jgi:hypothetical protein